MKSFYGFLVIVGIVGAILASLQLKNKIMSGYHFEKSFLQEWHLADKSSTIPAKQQHIAQFVKALEAGYERGEFAAHNAVFLKTENNAFKANLTAVKTLASRLDEIQTMNPSSFEYNTAIQQITAQEQGEAMAMLTTIKGCYLLGSYPMIWSWIGGIIAISSVLMVVAGCFGIATLIEES